MKMAQRGIQIHQQTFCCSICLDLLNIPVTIPCGHSYCMSCIQRHWDKEDHKEACSCPQCRQTFGSRPLLVKNTMLADLVEEMKKTGLQTAPADHCYAGPGDVGCDFCTGRKLKALKSCLQCLVSYCEQHLQPHYESPAFQKHKLVEPSKKLQENICTRHNEVMKIFCRTDQQCICYLCSMDEHEGHETVLALTERAERQKEVGVSQQKIQHRIQMREKDVKLLQQEVETLNRSADKAVEDSEKIFKDLIQLIEKRSSAVKQLIRSQRETMVSRVKELEKKLQQELADLRQKDTKLEQLLKTEDQSQFLRDQLLLLDLTDCQDSSNINARIVRDFEDVKAVVSDIRDKLQDVLSEAWTKISLKKPEVDVLQPQAEPKTRAEFLQYSREITLDPDTASTELAISHGDRSATMIGVSLLRMLKMSLQLHSFESCSQQVLSRESLTGRCYWEVKWYGHSLSVAVTYPQNAAHKSVFGNNDKSWALYCFRYGYEFRHNNIRTPLPVPRSSKVGVYLDHVAGILCFYSVSETMTLLHRVQTTFTQPLYAGLCVGYDSIAEIQ